MSQRFTSADTTKGAVGAQGVSGSQGTTGVQGVTGSAGVQGVTGSASPYNYLINGDFNIWQRTGTTSGGAALNYGGCVADRWFPTNSATTKTSATMIPTTGTGAALCGAVFNNSGGFLRMAMNQMVESQVCYALRGRSVTFQAQLQTNGGGNMRMAIISLKGTTDSYTGTSIDVVSTWTNTTYTTGNFFKATSGSTTYTVVGVSSSFAAPAFGTVYSVSGTVPTDCTNLCCIIWTEGLILSNGVIEAQNCGLFDGSSTVPWLPRLQAQEEIMCLRYYQKSYPRATPVPTNSTAAGFCVVPNLNSGTVANQANYGWTYFNGPMRITPTIAVYSYATSTANISADETGSENAAGSATANQQTERGFTAYNNSGSSLTHVSFGLIFHWSADAEFVT